MKSMNPYADVGTIASGARFVGRTKEVARLSAVGRGKSSRALVGLPRSGKSTLANRLYEEWRVDKSAQTLWIDVSTIGGRASIVSMLLGMLDPPLEVQEGDLEGAKEVLKAKLEDRTRRGFRTVVIFDEFDTVDTTLEPFFSIRIIREIVYKPHQFGLTALFLCRRRLENIEERVVNLSNLTNVALMQPVKPFGADEVKSIISRGWRHGLSGEAVEALRFLAGGVPYLVELVLYELWEEGDVGSLSERIAPTLNSYYVSVVRTLEADGYLENLLKIAKSEDLESYGFIGPLIDYGICFRYSSGRVRVYPDSFCEYLRSIDLTTGKSGNLGDSGAIVPGGTVNNFYSYGSANIAVGSSNFSQSTEAARRTGLFDALSNAGVDEEDLDELRAALAFDEGVRDVADGADEGPEVRQWKTRVLEKLASSGTSVATAAATTAVTGALSAYFGIG